MSLARDTMTRLYEEKAKLEDEVEALKRQLAEVTAERDAVQRAWVSAKAHLDAALAVLPRSDIESTLADMVRNALAEAKREAAAANERVRTLETALARVAVAIDQTHPDTALAIRQTLEGR